MADIDVVITWVDGNDPEWLRVRRQYEKIKETRSERKLNDTNAWNKSDNSDDTNSAVRFRDWDNLQYVLRSIEKNMSWVRKIHLVTWGHLPKWICKDSKKLNIVRHEDFIPSKYLPTFNSNAIELNLHRIPGIADSFICFNDDMFVVKETRETDFFKDGMPCDMASISPQPIYRSTIMNIELNNLKIINDYFSVNNIKENKKKWLSLSKYGQYAVRTGIFLSFKTIIGIFQPHVPYTLRKSTYETLWDKEGELLDATCSNRFRSTEDVNIWLLRSWQLVSGEFFPRRASFGQLIPASDIAGVRYFLGKKSKCKMVCINDDDSVIDFENTKKLVNDELDRLFPEKSSMEL